MVLKFQLYLFHGVVELLYDHLSATRQENFISHYVMSTMRKLVSVEI